MRKILNLYSSSTDGINAAVHSIDWLMLYTDRFPHFTLIAVKSGVIIRSHYVRQGSSNGMACGNIHPPALIHKSLTFLFYSL